MIEREGGRKPLTRCAMANRCGMVLASDEEGHLSEISSGEGEDSSQMSELVEEVGFNSKLGFVSKLRSEPCWSGSAQFGTP